MDEHESPAVAEAKDILRAHRYTAPDQVLGIVKQLKKEQAFNYARQLLKFACSKMHANGALATKLRQQHALCMYKDADLPADLRLQRAEEILNDIGDLLTTTDQETLGIAGGIFKRKWELTGQISELERSLGYYSRGYEQGIRGDQGYTAINTAYVLDVLASQEEAAADAAGCRSQVAAERRCRAAKIRQDIAEILPTLAEIPGYEYLSREWFFYATLVEAYFGLKLTDKAGYWVAEGRKHVVDIPKWEMEATARQLARLLRSRATSPALTTKADGQDAWNLLKNMLGVDLEAAKSISSGKIGLALSGGGFRAALFHIGVLAKLAEADILRNVEVLSCVSGGSIVGAYYYLKVRNLLESKPDSSTGITRRDYIQIVDEVVRDFLVGVQKNIRTRVIAEFSTNLKLMLWPYYSRTQRVGQLYERILYANIPELRNWSRRWLLWRHEPFWLNRLFVTPQDANGRQVPDFKPKYDNWRRYAKVPILVINATTLNTGHNWQFTASFFGEPPAGINSEVDGNERLRRMYYRQAPPRYQQVRLGQAVAASSCVPGLFEPLSLPSLYDGRVVRLVDGGVHDNQGIQSLLEQDCEVLLISDASGQMARENHPSAGVLGVPLRSNSILQARLRGLQCEELAGRKRSNLMHGLMFVHLKKDLDEAPVPWRNCQEPDDPDLWPAKVPGEVTSYGITKRIQRLLSDLRTDLDSFTDAEAYSLMTSGYRMVESELPKSLQSLLECQTVPPRERWPFLAIEPALTGNADSERLEQQLRAGSEQAFKIWRLNRALKYCVISTFLILLAALVWFRPIWWPIILLTLTLGIVAIVVLIAIGNRTLGKPIMRLLNYRKTLSEFLIGLILCLGFVLARIHLHIFDKIFLRQGRLDQMIGKGKRMEIAK